MNCDLFLNMYWSQYILLEKEFCKSLSYVSLSQENYNTFSNAFLKLILQTGSEIDISLKMLCSIFDPQYDGQTINQHLHGIQKYRSDFFDQVVEVRAVNEDIKIKPWKDYDSTPNNSLCWWKVYNKVKHDRTKIGTINAETREYYKFANLKNALYSLAALYHILVFAYYTLAKNDMSQKRYIVTPLPGSGLFCLTGGFWNSVTFYNDNALYVNEDGNLILEYGLNFPYG